MNVLEVDEVPVFVIAAIRTNAAVELIWDVALLPGRHLGLERANLGPGLHLCVDPARPAAPAGEIVWGLGVVAGEIQAHDGVRLDVRILRQVLEHADDPEIAGDALRDHAERAAKRILPSEPAARFRLRDDHRLRRTQAGAA